MKTILTSLLATCLCLSPTMPLSAEMQTAFPGRAAKELPAGLPWVHSYDQAVSQAKSTGQSIVLLFSADWCSCCRILEAEILRDPNFAKTLNNEFLFVYVDQAHKLPLEQKQQNQQLLKRYNVSGLPTLVVVNAEGSELGRTNYQKMSPHLFAVKLQGLKHTTRLF